MRYEKKFIVEKNNLNLFNSWLNQIKGIKTSYPDRIVNSIYFDNSNLEFAYNNLSGISYRYKFRIRWYGKLDTNYNYEIKIKKNELGKKLKLSSKSNLSEVNIKKLFSYHNEELNNYSDSKKIHYYITNYNLEPILETNYQRSYYSFMNKLSLTFDRSLRFKKYKDEITTNYVNDSLSIMEIKFNPEDIQVAKNFFKKCIFTNSRFSKYLRGLAVLGMAQYL